MSPSDSPSAIHDTDVHLRRRYFAKISSVFPPQRVREAAAAEPSTSAEPDSYEAIAHKLGIDMNADAKRAKAEDNPDEYLYKLQLMDEEHKFEGSTMEVGSRLLSCVFHHYERTGARVGLTFAVSDTL